MSRMPRDSASVVLRSEVHVLFLRTRDVVEDIQRGWARLEGLVGTRGRKFYGALDVPTGEYRVCVERRAGDDASALGLETGILPGGRYLRMTLRGEPPAVYDRIGPTFNEIDLLVPVAE